MLLIDSQVTSQMVAKPFFPFSFSFDERHMRRL